MMTRGFPWQVYLAPCAVALAIVPVLMPFGTPAKADNSGAVPVVVELFTSEGCSSCPPADDLLTQLASTQPVPGAKIIALGEHVDYWDHQGWRDQFGSAKFTDRQNDYAQRVFGPDQVYTPQVVVDGTEQVIGNDPARVTAAIAKAAKNPAPRVSLALTPAPAGQTINVKVDATIPETLTLKDKADVLIGITEDALSSQVQRGENKGRELHHSAVVRTLVQAGTIPNGQHTWSGTQQLKLPAGWNASRLRVFALVQDRSNRHIVGANIAPLASS